MALSPIPVPNKTMGQEIRDSLIETLIFCFFFYIITGLLKVLFWPVRYLFMSDDAINREDMDKMLQKVHDRKRYLEAVRDNFDDPMYQYRQRFLENPDRYSGDEYNEEYLAWYMAWKNGEILDTHLRWVPDVYVELDGQKTMNSEFINYLEYQADLHRTAPFVSRINFIRTLKKYYPEVTPDLGRIDQDLSELRGRTQVREAREELVQEVRRYGVPENVARELCKETDPKVLKTKSDAIKRGLEAGYCPSAAQFIAEKNIEVGTETAKNVDLLCKNHAPMAVVEAYGQGLLTTEETDNVIGYAADILKHFGTDLFSPGEDGKTVFDNCVESRLHEIVGAKRKKVIDQKIGESAWQRLRS